MLCRVVLCHDICAFVVCRVVLRCVALCCVVLNVLCCVVLCCVVLCCLLLVCVTCTLYLHVDGQLLDKGRWFLEVKTGYPEYVLDRWEHTIAITMRMPPGQTVGLGGLTYCRMHGQEWRVDTRTRAIKS